MNRSKPSIEMWSQSAETLVDTLLHQVQKLLAELANVQKDLMTLRLLIDNFSPEKAARLGAAQQGLNNAHPAQARGEQNFVKQHMARSLRAGTKRGQPVEILKLLARERKPQTMSQIVEYMRGERTYKASRYYDASNALVEAGLASRTFVDGEIAWVATDSGLSFVSR